jgi:hypothetical protein
MGNGGNMNKYKDAALSKNAFHFDRLQDTLCSSEFHQ